jgi:hypothetical protein
MQEVRQIADGSLTRFRAIAARVLQNEILAFTGTRRTADCLVKRTHPLEFPALEHDRLVLSCLGYDRRADVDFDLALGLVLNVGVLAGIQDQVTIAHFIRHFRPLLS